VGVVMTIMTAVLLVSRFAFACHQYGRPPGDRERRLGIL